MAGRLTLITGGVRSGKSRYALELAQGRHAAQSFFIATCEPLDDEMKLRIRNHRKERGDSFSTIEEPLSLGKAVLKAASSGADLILIDCLTLWVNNLLYYHAQEESAREKEILAFLETLRNLKTECLVVTNEVGLGILPETKISRAFVDLLGRVNRETASLCDEVILMVAGIPAAVKGNRNIHETIF